MMCTKANVRVVDEVCTILARVLRLPRDTVMATSPIRALPNADSTTILEAVIAIEDHFGIEFPDALVFRIESVGDIAAVIHDLLEATTQPYGKNSAKEGNNAS